jgi:hypothetical protein
MSRTHNPYYDTITPVTDISLNFVEGPMSGGNGDNIMSVLNQALQIRSSVAGRHIGGNWDSNDDESMYGGAKAKKKSAKGTSGRGASPGFRIFSEVGKILRNSGLYPEYKVAEFSAITKLIRDDVLKEMKTDKVDEAIFAKIIARAKAQHAEYVRKYKQQQKGGADYIRYLF